MSYFGSEFFGGEFHSHYYGEYVGVSVFFGGEFFDGGFYKSVEQSASTGGKGDNPRKSIYKPTGLTYRKTPEQRVRETREIHREIRETLRLPDKPKPIEIMSLAEIEAEIGERLRRAVEKDDEEIILMLLAAAAG